MGTISIILVILSAATATAQNYPLFLREAEQASLMSSENLSTGIGRNGASSRSGVYNRRTTRTMPLVGAFKTLTHHTAIAELSSAALLDELLAT